jgi:hypothetical protein
MGAAAGVGMQMRITGVSVHGWGDVTCTVYI